MCRRMLVGDCHRGVRESQHGERCPEAVHTIYNGCVECKLRLGEMSILEKKEKREESKKCSKEKGNQNTRKYALGR